MWTAISCTGNNGRYVIGPSPRSQRYAIPSAHQLRKPISCQWDENTCAWINLTKYCLSKGTRNVFKRYQYHVCIILGIFVKLLEIISNITEDYILEQKVIHNLCWGRGCSGKYHYLLHRMLGGCDWRAAVQN